MGNNVFRFRRIKWGDPAEKLKMLPDQQKVAFRWSWEHIAIAFGLLVISILAYLLWTT